MITLAPLLDALLGAGPIARTVESLGGKGYRTLAIAWRAAAAGEAEEFGEPAEHRGRELLVTAAE